MVAELTTSWRVMGGSTTGTSHVRSGTPCQDSHGWSQRSDDGGCVLAVADGAGSRPRAAAGSELVVATLAGAGAASDASAELAMELLVSARNKLDERAQADGSQVGDYACTVALVLVGTKEIHIAQVGDTIVVVSTGEELTVISPAPKYEYANQTDFLTSNDWQAHVRLVSVPREGVLGIALSTDGLRYKILDDMRESVPYRPFFEDMFAYVSKAEANPTAIAAFLSTLEDQTGDDLTLLIAVPSSLPGAESRTTVVNAYRSTHALPIEVDVDQDLVPGPDISDPAPAAEDDATDPLRTE